MAFRFRSLFSTRSRQSTFSAELLEANAMIEQGCLEQAAMILRELASHDRGHAEAWYKLGNVLKDLNRPSEALTSYNRAIQMQPRHTAAHCNRGVLHLALGKIDEALSDFRMAVEIDPNDAIARYNCATAQHSVKQSTPALESYGIALQLNPDYAEAYFSRGLLHEEMERWPEALSDYDHALALRPGMTQVHFHQGNVLARLGRWLDALARYDRALAFDPEHGLAHLHRGNVLRQLQRWEDALSSYNRAIAIKPNQVDGYFNRAVLFEQLKQFSAALASLDLAITIRPDFAPAQYNRALVLLTTGDLISGFINYEWRWKNRGISLDPSNYHGVAPLWFGQEPLKNKTILIFSEQGFGDTLQFCRYIQLLAKLGAKVVFEVQPPLAELLANIEGASIVIPRGAEVPPCDYKCALLSLPLAFKTTLENIPVQHKYLEVDPIRIKQWQSRLGPKTRPRIGLAWSGNAQYPNDHQRSMPLAIMAGQLPSEFEYFCLQTDIRSSDRASLDMHPFIVDYSLDFINTAALCECLDLVITVCTSVAHLAGALDKPVWILLAYNADWRWLENRDDSPWYPSAKLFRQATYGDWHGVAAKVGHELRREFE